MEQTTVQSSNSERIMKALHSVWTTVQPWAQRNVTFGLVLAVCTEVPRWVFAFKAAHEPIWAGCALAILISYAAAHAWEEYFAQHDWLLLALNSLSLFFGVYTIAPVLYLMSSANDHTTVALSDVFGPWFIGSWAIVLACTTFLPLIQVAVVEVRRRERAQRSVQPITQRAKFCDQPSTTPTDASLHPVQKCIEVPATDDAQTIDARTQALQMHSNEMPAAEIARILQQKESTVRSWIRRSNGATKVSA